MARYFYGTDELTQGWEPYFELCNAFELDLERFEEPPKIETLNQWRVESPKNFCFILHLDPAITRYLETGGGGLSEDETPPLPDEIEEAWDRTLERAEAVAARALHLPTGEAFTPGGANRDRLGRLADELFGTQDRPVLWEPSGLWNIEQTRTAADEAGITPVYNPFIANREGHEFTHGDVGFAITERPGMRRQFDLFDFRQLLDWTDNYDRVFVMLRGRHKWAHARELAEAVEETRGPV